MKKQIVVLTGLIVSIGIPGTVFASPAWQQMENDLNTWSNDLQIQGKQNDLDQSNQLFQQSPELFPDLTKLGLVKLNPIDAIRGDRTAGFVTATIGGVFVAFSDTSASEWYAPYLRSVAESGMLTGYRDSAGIMTGKFGPADPVTVEQVAKSVLASVGVSASQCQDPPHNVTASGSWSAPYIACAEKRQWSLYADASVNVHRPATRVEVIVTVLQAFNIVPDTAVGTVFTDVPATIQYANYIEKAAKDGIISGYTNADGSLTGTFGPTDTITRAEFSKMLTLAVQVYKK